MKSVTLFSLVLGLAAGLPSLAQAALPAPIQADINSAVSGNRVLYLAGSDALKPFMADMATALFTSTPVHIANTNAGVHLRDHAAILGIARSDAGTWANQAVVILYNTAGGAARVIQPTVTGAMIETLNITSSSCASAGNGSAQNPYVCPVSTASSGRTPDIVVSDTDLTIHNNFQNLFSETPFPIASDLEVSQLLGDRIALFSRAEGVAVTKNVSPSTKINKAAVSAVVAANLLNWSEVDEREPATEDIVVCLKTPMSGTKVTSNRFFLNVGCGSGLAGAPGERDSNDVNADGSLKWDSVERKYVIKRNSGWVTFVENSTDEDVAQCLNSAYVGGSYTTGDRDGNRSVTVEFHGAGHRAIGLLPLTMLNGSTPSSNWQFRSLGGAGSITLDGGVIVTSGSGIFPTKENHLDGTWEYTSIPSFNFRSSVNQSQKAYGRHIARVISSPAFLASLQSVAHRAGVATLPTTYSGFEGALPPRTGPIGTPTNNALRAEHSANIQCTPIYKNW